MYFLKGFNESANKAVQLAMKSAQDMGHIYVGSEHLLLGICKEGTSVSAALLLSRGITAPLVEHAVAGAVGTGTKTNLHPEDFSKHGSEILENAVKLATEEGSPTVTPEHVMWALAACEKCAGVEILNSYAIDGADLFKDNDTQYKAGGKNSYANGSEKSFKSLEKYGRDLTALAAAGKLDPCFCRDEETQQLVRILSRRQKNNPCLLGEAGVGKTAVVEGFALRIAAGDVPENLLKCKVISVDVSGMLAGTKYRGDFEERMRTLLADIEGRDDIILFVDEMHALVGAGAAEGAVDAASILKPALARGAVRMIGATTFDEYAKSVEKDAALERRFQPVMVEEPSAEDTLQILQGLKERYETHHGTEISQGALSAAVNLSVRYIPSRRLPDKAIDAIDEAASAKKLQGLNLPKALQNAEHEWHAAVEEKVKALKMGDYRRAEQLQEKENACMQQTLLQRRSWQEQKAARKPVVNEDDVREVISHWAGVPIGTGGEEEREKLLALEEVLGAQVLGQQRAVQCVSAAIRRARAGVADPARPVGAFLFIGPSGVGKTALAKAVADAVFGTKQALVRIDMSEYSEKHTVSRLIGPPPGYVGYEEGGVLSGAVRKNPYCVVLLDEIEKAHSEVHSLLLQIMEDGTLTDAKGRKINFRNTIIIMTGNIGAQELAGGPRPRGFGAQAGAQGMQGEAEKLLARYFSPEFLNRLDESVVFNRLTQSDARAITQKILDEIAQRVAHKGIQLLYDEQVVDYLVQKGFSAKEGARPLRRLASREIEDKLARYLLSRGEGGGAVRVKMDGGRLVLRGLPQTVHS